MEAMSYFVSHNTNGTEFWGPKDTERQKKFIFAYMKNEFGWSPTLASAFMGNLEHEGKYSSSNLEEWWVDNNNSELRGFGSDNLWFAEDYVNQIEKKVGWGVVQWTTVDRKRALYNFAEKQGSGIEDLSMQLDFMYQELTSPDLGYNGKYIALYNELIAQDKNGLLDINNATKEILRRFESPREWERKVEERQQSANEVYKAILEYLGE